MAANSARLDPAIERLLVRQVLAAAAKHAERQVQVSPHSSEYQHTRYLLHSTQEVLGTTLRWNGRLVEARPQDSGAVSIDGTLALSRKLLDTIDRAFSGDTDDLDPEEVYKALYVAGHEGSHLAGLPAQPTVADIQAFIDKDAKALDEGIADHNGRNHAIDIAVATGLLPRVPGLLAVMPGVGYPAAWQATGTLVTHLSTATQDRVKPREIFTRLFRSPPSDRWRTIADLRMEDVPLVGAAGDREGLRDQLGQTMRAAFAEVGQADGEKGLTARQAQDKGDALMTTACHVMTMQTVAHALPGMMTQLWPTGPGQDRAANPVPGIAAGTHRPWRHPGMERS